MCDDPRGANKITKIHCLFYKEFYPENSKQLDSLQGHPKTQVQNWINESTMVKKNNFFFHLTSNVYAREKQTRSAGQLAAQDNTSQTTIVQHARDLKKKSQKAPLIKTFQLAHFLIVKIKSFNFYKDLVTSKKEVHNVDLGTAYFSKYSAQEMIMYLSKSIVLENITEPLNTGERLYFSWLFDGSSSATTIDEKEVYIIKPCSN